MFEEHGFDEADMTQDEGVVKNQNVF